MAKNLNDIIEVNHDASKDEIDGLLNEGRTLLLLAHKGSIVKASLKKGYSDYFKASIEVVSEGNYQGVCGCGKPNNIKLYLWRD